MVLNRLTKYPLPPLPPPVPGSVGVSAAVFSASGTLVWSVPDLAQVSQNLHWPSPTLSASYAIKDFPRFYAPPWGPTPIPASATVDPALLETNGYDYRINQDGDTYVFLLGSTLDAWSASRVEFITLAGPTPVLPDFAFGTWFTWWHPYTEVEAKGEVERWQASQTHLDLDPARMGFVWC